MGERTAKQKFLHGLFAAAVYLAVFVPFALLQDLNPYILVRPSDGVGPVLGLVLGWPGIFGCTGAWGIGQALTCRPEQMPYLQYSIACQLVYLALPYIIWRGVFLLVGLLRPQSDPDELPRLNTSAKVALFVIAAFVDALFAGWTFYLFDVSAGSDVSAAREVGFYHSMFFLMYVGIPCMLALSRRLSTRLGASEHTGHVHRSPSQRLSLGELVVTLFLAVIAAFSTAFFFVGYGSYFVDGTIDSLETALDFVFTFYVVACQLAPAGLAVMIFAVHVLNRRAARPIEALTRSTSTFVEALERRRAEGGKLEVAALNEKRMAPAAEVRALIDTTEAMQRDLVDYVEQLESVTAERERVEAELDIARNIQASAIPHDFVAQTAHGLAVDGFMRPAREVGGDFYDVFDVGEDATAFVVGDVSGKGVPAALFMMRAQGLLHSCVMAERDLGVALAEANRGLCENNDAMLFVTAFACVLDRRTGMLSFANAGHNPPSVRRGGVRTYLRCKPGLVLGAMDGMAYMADSISFAPGDELLLYTDGVTEAANVRAELFGETRLAGALDVWDMRSEQVERSIAEALVTEIDAFAGDAPQADDITLLNMSWDIPAASIEVSSEDAELDALFGFLEERVGALAPGFSIDDAAAKRLLFSLKLVVEELFVNVCHYGHPDASAVTVRLSCAVDEGLRVMHLTFEDEGIAYDPLGHEVVMPEATGPVGGLGIHLVRSTMDSVAYERQGERNVLYLTKALP